MGGAESRMIDVYEVIGHSKFQFDFLTMQTDLQYYENKIIQLGGRIIKITPPRISGGFANLKTIYHIIKSEGYDAVHAHTSFHCGLVMLAAWLAHVPVRVSHARTTGSKILSIKNRAALFVGRILIKLFATDCVAISPEAGKYLFNNSFMILPNAINTDKYQCISTDQLTQIKKQFQLEKDDLIIGMIGRFESMKNHKFAITWFSAFRTKYQNAKLILIGDGIDRDAIKNMVDLQGIQESVIFTGIRNDVPIWMNIFDVLIVPSIFEGLGGVILEAQAAGTPVVKSDSFTNAADLGIDMVKEANVDDLGGWTKAVSDQLNLPIPDLSLRNEAFKASGYSLNNEISMLTNIYEGG